MPVPPPSTSKIAEVGGHRGRVALFDVNARDGCVGVRDLNCRNRNVCGVLDANRIHAAADNRAGVARGGIGGGADRDRSRRCYPEPVLFSS